MSILTRLKSLEKQPSTERVYIMDYDHKTKDYCYKGRKMTEVQLEKWRLSHPGPLIVDDVPDDSAHR